MDAYNQSGLRLPMLGEMAGGAMSLVGPNIWWVMAAYLALSMLAVAYLPRMIAPSRASARAKEQLETIDLRNKVRQTVVQISGGLGFLFSIFVALNAQETANKDQRERFERETAELFVKVMESKNAENLYVLGRIARRDKKNYHDLIYRMIASQLRTASFSLTNCAKGDLEATKLAVLERIRIGMQLLHESVADDESPTAKHNIEYVCLAGLDLSVDWGRVDKFKGFEGARMSSSRLMRIDFSGVYLKSAELMGIDAGDWHNGGWLEELNRLNLHELTKTGDLKWKAERRRYVAHFVGSNLEAANFNGAGLEGADFSDAILTGASFEGANISRANFRGAKGLALNQLRTTCVGKYGSEKHRNTDEQRVEQPLFWSDQAVKKELDADTEFKGMIPLC
jgi:uncharacterized protein YjbI with pentapeptide repeats